MSALIDAMRDLVKANRILAHEGVLDAYGHITVRHPDDPQKFLMSRSRSPEHVSLGDIVTFKLDGTPIDDLGRPLYSERPIHAAIYEARADVMAVVHNHSYDLIPFGVTGTPLRPIAHTAGGIGHEIPVWDIRDKFGDGTHLLVREMDKGRDLAKTLGGNRVVLMRGHGCAVAAHALQQVVMLSLYLQINARMLMNTLGLAPAAEIDFLAAGEIDVRLAAGAGPRHYDRAWEYLVRRAGCEGL